MTDKTHERAAAFRIAERHIAPVSRTTLSEQVASQIARAIATGRWKPGDRVPAEPDLCRAFNVGRSTIREAMKSLAYAGAVRMRAGGGTYVADHPSQLFDRMFCSSPFEARKSTEDLIEMRLLLEAEAASLCAARTTKLEVTKLLEVIDAMRATRSLDAFPELDMEFHRLIALSSKNKLLYELSQRIRERLQKSIEKTFETPNRRRLTVTHHARILEAIRQGDAEKARSRMKRHLLTASLVVAVPVGRGKCRPVHGRERKFAQT